MIQRRSTGIVVVLLTVIGVLWIVSGIRTATQPIARAPVAHTLLIHHFVVDGVHTYTGAIDTACRLGVAIAATGSSTPQVVLALSEQQSTGPCENTLGQEFSASVAAVRPVLERVTLDGVAMRIQLIEQ